MAEAEKKQKKDSGEEMMDFSQVKRGEYHVHLFVEETRGLVNPSGSGTIDPIIRVSCFGQKAISQPKKEQGGGMTYWGEHYFFDK